MRSFSSFEIPSYQIYLPVEPQKAVSPPSLWKSGETYFSQLYAMLNGLQTAMSKNAGDVANLNEMRRQQIREKERQASSLPRRVDSKNPTHMLTN